MSWLKPFFVRSAIAAFATLIGSALLAQNKGKSADSGIKVITATGWFHGKVAIQRNDSLPAVADLTAIAGASDLVLQCGPTVWYAYNCGGQPCTVPVCATKVDKVNITRSDPSAIKGRWGENFGGLIASLIRHEPKDPATLGVRAGGNPNDAVVLQATQGVHWGPALNRVLEGRYCFRLSSRPAGSVRQFTLDWDRSVESEGVGPAQGLTPGVYALDKGSPGSNGACTLDPDAASAWVVVAAEPDFTRINADWKDSAPWFSQLEQSGSGPAVAATARHAVLAFLADSLTKR